MLQKSSLTVIVPFYKEEFHNLEKICKPLKDREIKCIIVDDCSNIPIWEGKFLTYHNVDIIHNKRNKGYGLSIKTGIYKAKTKYVAIIDADGQYDIKDLLELWDNIGNSDMLVGKRNTAQGGISRLFGRMFMKLFASLCCMRYIPDLNSGLRIFKRTLAENYSAILCNEFSYTSSLTVAMLIDGYNVNWHNISFYQRHGTKSTVRKWYHGLVTIYQLLFITIGLRTRGIRRCFRE